MKEAPTWLMEFQQCFGAVLRTPLTTSSGTFRSQLPSVWTQLGVKPRSQRAAASGLSDYHRQYWFRLLTLLQVDFPLSSRLMGLWSFNLLAQDYLQKTPPHDYDLSKIRQDFFNDLRQKKLPSHVHQAACLDEARSLVFMAPDYQPWHWRAEAMENPALARLVAAPDWRIVEEDWALLDLCLRLGSMPGEKALPCPAPHSETQFWMIQRHAEGLVYRSLHPAQGRLYELLSRHTIQDAVMNLEGEFAHQDSTDLQASVQSWMGLSVSWGLWASSD